MSPATAAAVRLAPALAAPATAPDLDEVLLADSTVLLQELRALERARQVAQDPYARVRALAYAAACCRYALQDAPDLPHGAPVPVAAWRARLDRRHAEAVAVLWAALDASGPGRFLLSELGACYHAWQYEELAQLVRAAIRDSRGSAWLFRCGSLLEYPLRLRRELRAPCREGGLPPVLEERTPVRLDLSHSGWSDIFFLAMEEPAAARVVNISVDLLFAADAQAPTTGTPRPPITVCLRAIAEPVLRLTAVDLGESVDCRELEQVFDYAADHLGLLKAAVVASGLVPPALEGTRQSLRHLLAVLVGPGCGIELCSRVERIPKGSRLAVSTNLLASAIACCMRATGQTAALEGDLAEDERRVIAARAILGEWLGGSGGGWQDSGGIWPGIKLIAGETALPGDPEHGRSPGRLLPRHQQLVLTDQARRALEASLVVFHGGMAGNVGPVLELVTSKHLVGWCHARRARRQLREGFEAIIAALLAGDCRGLGRLTQAAYQGPLRAIIPGVGNAYTDAIVAEAQRRYGDGFWGFVMLGGMAGGGMAMLVDPAVRPRVDAEWAGILAELARRHGAGLPFAIAPLTCSIAINECGSVASLRRGAAARFPDGYYQIQAPLMARLRHEDLAPQRREDLLHHLEHAGIDGAGQSRLLHALAANLLPEPPHGGAGDRRQAIAEASARYGVDAGRQERMQQALKAGRISLNCNRLPPHAPLEPVPEGTVRLLGSAGKDALRHAESLLTDGRVAVVTMAGGLGSRWSGGSGVVKALAPVVELGGAWRSFQELHRRAATRLSPACPQVFTTGFLTDAALRAALADDPAPPLLSPGMLVGQRAIPTLADLRSWLEELPRAKLDERAEKARADRDRAWLAWATASGPGEAYTDNVPEQVFHPPGHWWELPGLIANGTLVALLERQPRLERILLRNIDTLGAVPDAAALACHLASGATLSFELIERLTGDTGGSLALVAGRPRLVEGLAMPDEELELQLPWYNANTCWVDLEGLLAWFGLDKATLADRERCRGAVLRRAEHLPTYITIKEVARRWGRGQVDHVPVAQFEQLWGDMSAAPDLHSSYIGVPRRRGQQLKDVGQLPGWILDGSAAAVAAAAGLSPPG